MSTVNYEKIVVALNLENPLMLTTQFRSKVTTPKYYGGSQTDLIGSYKGKISVNEWLKIDSLVKNKRIKDTILTQSSFEDTYFDLSIKFGNKEHYISGYYSTAPLEIKLICELVISIKKKIKFVKTSTVHPFSVKAYMVKRKINDSISFVVPKVQ